MGIGGNSLPETDACVAPSLDKEILNYVPANRKKFVGQRDKREFKLRVYELRQTAKLVLFPEFLPPLIIFCLAFSRYVIYFML